MSRFVDSIDIQNKLVGLLIGAPSSNQVTIIADSGASNRTITIPDGVDATLVTDTYAQELTNKAITDPSNNVAARSLFTTIGTDFVTVDSGLVPPTVGQVLKVTSPGVAQWQDDSAAPPYSTYVGSSGATTNDTATPLIGNIPAATNDSVYYLSSNVVVKNADASIAASYTVKQAFKNVGGTVTAIGDINDVVLFSTSPLLSNGDTSNGNVRFTISGTNIQITVTGINSTNLSWRASTTVVSV